MTGLPNVSGDTDGPKTVDEWFETIIKRDVISLPIMPFTPQMFGWFKQPFTGWQDLKGRKMRAVGMNAQILHAAGLVAQAGLAAEGGKHLPQHVG